MKLLSEDQITGYQENGYLVLPGFLDQDWLDQLTSVTERFVEKSKGVSESDLQFDVEPQHSADNPRLRRLISPVDQDEAYWSFASNSPIVDLVEDLIGSNIKFHHGKLNFKFPRGGEEVKWHQDIQFWPHTNYDLLTVGVYLYDVQAGQGEMGFIPGSHKFDLFNLYEGDRWTGHIQEEDLDRAAIDTAVYPVGPAGTVTLHNCRTIHGSSPNFSDHQRPLLLQTYAPADAIATTDLVNRTPHGNEIVRGEAARWARHDPRPCLMPPHKIGTIFQAQQKELESGS